MDRPCRNAAALVPALLAGAVLVAGCASPTYDPQAPTDEPLRRISVYSPLGVEETLRRLYSRLERCAGFGYHVQPRFERDSGRAFVMVVSGLGLDRYSLFGNRFGARFDLVPDGAGTRIDATLRDPELDATVPMIPRWLRDPRAGCVE